MKRIGWMAVLVLFMTGLAFAAQDVEAAKEAVSSFDWNNLWKMAIAGVLASVLGAAKNGKFNPKDWSIEKIGQKAILGLIIGAIAAWKGIGIDAAESWLVGGSLVYVLDYVFKAVFKGAAISVKKVKEAAANATNP